MLGGLKGGATRKGERKLLLGRRYVVYLESLREKIEIKIDKGSQ